MGARLSVLVEFVERVVGVIEGEWGVGVVGKVVLTKNDTAHLCPLSGTVSGRVVPICSGPVVCCPLSALVLTNVHRILVVSAPHSLPVFHRLLNSNSRLNVRFRCGVRRIPGNLTRTFILNTRFLGNRGNYLVLNSGVFCNRNFSSLLHHTTTVRGNTYMFNCCIGSPHTCNIIRFSRGNGIVSVRRGPTRPGDGCTIPKLCFCSRAMARGTHGLGPSTQNRCRVASLGHLCLRRNGLGMRLFNHKFT